jgi:Carboxypeptidase regulatory-like domain
MIRGGEMKALRRMSLKGQLAVICSLLIVLEPLSGATAGPSAAGGRNSSTSNSLIAVAKVTGSVERNGQPLLNGSVVSSGDSLSTHDKSALLLTSTPQERIWLGANTSAKVSKSADTVQVSLIQGTVSFHTQGHLQVSFESHDGLALRSHAEGPASGEVSFGSHQEAQVFVQEGTLELVRGDHSVVLRPENSVSSANGGLAGASSAAAPQGDAGSIVGTVVSSQLFAVPSANITLTDKAGKTLTTQSNQEGKFFFKNVPPGSYTLHVVQTGYENYDLPNVVVRAGNESDLYVQLGGSGAASKGSNNHLVLWLVIGGAAAAAGIGAAVAAGHGSSSSSNSPSTP